MPADLTYPGVYIEEIPSGVRTITGVSTSVTAFVGQAKHGPINKPVRIYNFGDFERRFGGVSAKSEMSYAVRQYFLNGGREAWIVRLAKNPIPATNELNNQKGKKVLTITAKEAGKYGNNIEVQVDYDMEHPSSTFNLRLKYAAPDDPIKINEYYKDLSMNSDDPSYVEKIVNRDSELVILERSADLSTIAGESGTSISGELVDDNGQDLDLQSLIGDRHNQFRVVVNGSDPVKIQLESGNATDLDILCTAIEDKLEAASLPASCSPDGKQIKITSTEPGEQSMVRVLPGTVNDVSRGLKLGSGRGGIEEDAVAMLRPHQPLSSNGTLTSGKISTQDVDSISAKKRMFKLSLDEGSHAPFTVSFPDLGTKSLIEKLNDVALEIEAAVRVRNNPAYRGFTCQSDSSNTNDQKLVLSSGTLGSSSLVSVQAADSEDFAAILKLLPPASKAEAGHNFMLEGGNEEFLEEEDLFNAYIGTDRNGIFSLESVDLFNIFCLPGISDQGILAEAAAFCQKKGAFLVVDPPKNHSPEKIQIYVEDLPKTSHAAVYYPWVQVSDPLQKGDLRLCPPSGTIAGLFARTDANRGVWKAPAGTEASLMGVRGLNYTLSDGQNGTLNQLGINCLRTFPGSGRIAWGARTLRGADRLADEYKYVPVRRLALYIEESLYRGLQWVVFEPNDEPLWAQIRLNAGAFMHGLFRQGAFQGSTPREAYLVKCDSETTTQNDINLGVVNVLIGFAPLKPAEFVVIKIQQLAGQLAV